MNIISNLIFHCNNRDANRAFVTIRDECFSVLRQLRSIRRSVTRPVLQSLVVSLVLARLDYGNASLAGLPNTLLNRLQFVLNAAARLIHSARKHDHISPLLNDLHLSLIHI